MAMVDGRHVMIVVMGVVVLMSLRDITFPSGKSGSDDSNEGAPTKVTNDPKPIPTTSYDLNDITDDDDQPSPSQSWAGEVGKQKKTIPPTTLSHITTGPTMRFAFCYSCGYRKAFEEYEAVLHEKYPSLNVVGENYNPSLFRKYFVQGLSLTKMILIGLILSGVNPFQWLGMETPGIWNWVTQSRMYGIMILFLIGNTIESQLMASGAFEIYYNEAEVWSKLKTNRIPAPAELFQIIDNHNMNRGSVDTTNLYGF